MAQPYAPLIAQMLQDFQGQRLESAQRMAQSILRINPKDLVALQIYGLSLAIQNRVAEAVPPLAKAFELDPKNIELLANLAKAQHGAHLYQEASASYEKLNRALPNNPQILTDMGTSYAKSRHYEKASVCYDRAIELQGNYFLAWSNRGNLLADQGFPAQAVASYEKALNLNPEYAEAWTNLGNAFFDLGRFDDARLAHERALAINSQYGEAWSNYGNSLLELKQGEEALKSYQTAYGLVPQHPFLLGQLLNAFANNCDWEHSEPLMLKALEAVTQAKPATAPFIFLQTPASLAIQKQCAQTYIRERIFYSDQKPFVGEPYNAQRKIRIGYFSSDFKEHPVGILMENLIRLHDRSQFEVYGFFLNPKSGDALESRLTESFDKTVDLFGLNDQDAQRLVLETPLDIAIDLNGHTASARTGLFARKVAPIQINYLGYAGTSGANFYQYIIADAVAIPPPHQEHYTEKVLHLPNSFFPVDTLITPQEFGPMPTRASQELPENGFVFACFNNAYKISSQVFDIWMNLLKETPGSVLWLSKHSQTAMKNLQEAAIQHGVDATRLVFAARVPGRKDHLSRLRLADLFLDTRNFNAHATAADALWAGVPVLTVMGDTFASRVAASQLTALGLAEMIVDSDATYFEKALYLGNHPDAAQALKTQLEQKRDLAPLFNTQQYVKDLESLYRQVLQD